MAWTLAFKIDGKTQITSGQSLVGEMIQSGNNIILKRKFGKFVFYNPTSGAPFMLIDVNTPELTKIEVLDRNVPFFSINKKAKQRVNPSPNIRAKNDSAWSLIFKTDGKTQIMSGQILVGEMTQSGNNIILKRKFGKFVFYNPASGAPFIMIDVNTPELTKIEVDDGMDDSEVVPEPKKKKAKLAHVSTTT